MREVAKKFLNRFNNRTAFLHSLPQPARVLDRGCGAGINGTRLKILQPAVELHGVDVVTSPSLPDFYSFKTVDLDNGVLANPDNCFDAVFFTHVLEHLRAPPNLGSEIRRVMRQGARIYVETPNWTTVFAPSFGFHPEQHSPFNFFDDPTHVKPWSKHGLFEYLSGTCGLHVVKIGNARNWLRLPVDPLIILYALIQANRSDMVSSCWNLYGWCMYGVATKE